MSALFLTALLISGELPIQSAAARVDTERSVAAVVGTELVGAAGLLPLERGGVNLEASYAWHNSHLLLSGARTLPLYEGNLFAVTGVLGGSAFAPTRGPAFGGLGPEAAINLGVGRSVQGALSLSTGAQLFVGDPSISPWRFP